MSDDLMCQTTDSAKGDASDAQERATSSGLSGDAGKCSVAEHRIDAAELLYLRGEIARHIDQKIVAMRAVRECLDLCSHSPNEWLEMSEELREFKRKVFGVLEIRCLNLAYGIPEAFPPREDEVGDLAPSDVSHPDVPTLDTIEADFAEAIRLLHSYAYPGPTAYSLEREQSARDFIKKHGGSNV